MSLGLKWKMLLSYFAICLLLVFIGLLGSFSINKVESNYKKILDVNFKKINLAASLQGYSKDSNLPVLQLSSSTKLSGKIDDAESDFNSAVLKYTETKTIFDSLPFDSKETDIIKNLNLKWENYLSLSKKALSLAKTLSPESKTLELDTLINDDVDTARIELNDALARVSAYQKESAEELSNKSLKSSEKLTLISLLSVAIGFILSLFLGYIFSNNTCRALAQVQDSLRIEANNIKSSSLLVSENIDSLQSKLAHQASGVQETVVACEQVSAMVSKTAETALSSDQKTQDSQIYISDGSASIADLIQSVHKIIESFTAIKAEVVESQKGVQEVSSLINEIKTKTSVINEIVFQTKLLSFNASVEAARAGEQGKGFAVVAEEVGNLALMSGTAASEINTLIDKSSIRIVDIFNTMQTRIGTQLGFGESRIQDGQNKAENCEKIFITIQTIMTDIQSQVRATSSATQEQSMGVAEINKAVSMIDVVSQENAVISQQISETTLTFNHTADELSSAVNNLSKLLVG
ncbi:MAG: methyl-accepting chemotaxis protein [Pseudobdellovibrio sp.]